MLMSNRDAIVNATELFRDAALSQVPRILGLGDRRQDSQTAGCFDRYYWHYRFLDFPNLRFQEVAHLLAILWHEEFPGNIYRGKKNVRLWAQWAIQFWLQQRNRDGSVSEAYPFERSFCATSFSMFAITEALLVLGDPVPPSLAKTADWLIRNNNRVVSNQMAAAGLALYNCYLLTGIEKYRIASQNKMERLIQYQDPAGYFPEYGGCDIGYNSVTLSCLAQYCAKTNEERTHSAVLAAMSLLERSIKEDGTYAFDSGSRQTQFLYPLSFAIMQSDVIRRLVQGLQSNRILNPSWLDDRYVIQFTIDYLQTYLKLYHENDN
jgi:hypothetical protein